MERTERLQICDIRDELDLVLPRISFLAACADSFALLKRHGLHADVGEPELNGLAINLGEIETALARVCGKLENLAS